MPGRGRRTGAAPWRCGAGDRRGGERIGAGMRSGDARRGRPGRGPRPAAWRTAGYEARLLAGRADPTMAAGEGQGAGRGADGRVLGNTNGSTSGGDRGWSVGGVYG